MPSASRIGSENTPSRGLKIGFALLLGLVVLVAAAKPILFDTLDPDCFWHLRVATQLHTDGIGPIVDRMSFASIQTPWTPYSWLAELAMQWIWQLGGYRAAILATALMQGAIALAIAYACRFGRGPSAQHDTVEESLDSAAAHAAPSLLASILATAAAMFISLAYLSFRPVTAALVLMAVAAALLQRDRHLGQRTWSVWLVPPLAALVANIHLYVIFFPVWAGSLAAAAMWDRWRLDGPAARLESDRRVQRYLLLLLACAVACMLTPMLPGTLRSMAHYGADDPMVASSYIAEMQPFWRGTMGHVSLAIIAIMALGFLVNRKRLETADWLLLIGATVALFKLGRFTPVFAIVAAPMFARCLPRLSDRLLGRRAVWAVAGLTLGLGIWHVAEAFPKQREPMATWLNRHGPDAPGYPSAAADYVASDIQPRTGRLINEFSWGGYLEWRLGDRYQVFLDGRTQLFTPAFWHSTCLATPQRRLAFLSIVQADAAILPSRGSQFEEPLTELGWRIVYRDDRAIVLTPPAAAVAKFDSGEAPLPQLSLADLLFDE